MALHITLSAATGSIGEVDIFPIVSAAFTTEIIPEDMLKITNSATRSIPIVFSFYHHPFKAYPSSFLPSRSIITVG